MAIPQAFTKAANKAYQKAGAYTRRLAKTKGAYKDPTTGKFVSDIDLGKTILVASAPASGTLKRVVSSIGSTTGLGAGTLIYLGGKAWQIATEDETVDTLEERRKRGQ